MARAGSLWGPAPLLLGLIGACALLGSLAIRDEGLDASAAGGAMEAGDEQASRNPTNLRDPSLWGQTYEAPPQICPTTPVAVQYWKNYPRGAMYPLKEPECAECKEIRDFVGFDDKLTWVRMQGWHPGGWKVGAFTHILDGAELRGVPQNYQLPDMTEPDKVGGPPYAVFLYPLVDPNGGFAMTEQMCWRWACWRDHGYTVIVKRMRDPRQANEFFSQFPDYSIGHLALAGHGDRRSLLWSHDSGDIQVESSGPTKDMLYTLRKKLDHGANVFLDSCATAEGAGVFGFLFRLRNLLSFVGNNLPGHKVEASDVSFSGKQLEFKKEGEGNVCEVKGVMQENVFGTMKNHLKQRLTPHHCDELPAFNEWPSAWGGEMPCLSGCRASCSEVQRDDGTVIEEAAGGYFEKRWESNCNVGWRSLCVAIAPQD